jgi:putative Ca2+/H+ antiporter (TMEM165/GDT1 family)
MEAEPQPVISWKGVIGFVGWLLLLAGAFLVVFGCSSLIGSSCSSRLVIRSLAATGAGAFLLLARWVVWGDEDGSRGRSSPKSRLKRLLRNAVTYAILGILLAVFLAIGWI